ncbi:MAG TPA: ABC transporter substrate-binding protein [Chloroflexota bacterium]|nr:ABC transporter substrate-binding protein [Chloroflexota bacterium]
MAACAWGWTRQTRCSARRRATVEHPRGTTARSPTVPGRWRRALIVGLLALGASACGGAGPPSPTGPTTGASAAATPGATGAPTAPGRGGTPTTPGQPFHVVALDPGIIPAVPLYVALDRGYFAEEGLEVELQPSGEAATGAQMLAVGQAAFNMAVPDPVLFNALARNIDLKLLASATVNGPDDRPAAFLVRSDLIASGQYASPADLKGQTIATPAASSEFYVERVLRRGGLTLDDVQRVIMPVPDILSALASQRIAAAWEVEPLITAALRRNLATVIAGTGELFPGANGMNLVMAGGFGREQPEVARRFVVAYLRGLRDYYHAFNKGDGAREPVIQALVAHTVVKDPALYDVMGMHTVDPNGALNPASWDAFQEFYLRVGLQQQRVDLTRHIDESYLQAALDRLGREP